MSGEKAFFDTNLFIYLVEESEGFCEEVERVVGWSREHGAMIFTSALTVGEVLVKPKKENNEQLIDRYKKMFAALEIVPFDMAVAESFSEIRARFNIKAPDAMQLASAFWGRATYFITNDERLPAVEVGDMKLYSLRHFLLRIVEG